MNIQNKVDIIMMLCHYIVHLTSTLYIVCFIKEGAYFMQDLIDRFLYIFEFLVDYCTFYAAQLENFFVLICSVYLDVNFQRVWFFGHIPTFCVCLLSDTLMTSIFLQILGVSFHCIEMHICCTLLFFCSFFSIVLYLFLMNFWRATIFCRKHVDLY